MKKTDLTVALVKSVAKNNCIKITFPLIAVFRNTGVSSDGKTLVNVRNNGKNCTDLILCCDSIGVKVVATGRSLPHSKYLQETAQGISACNYVESQYAPAFWTRGNHLGYTGLVECGTAVIHRTRDAILGDDDDYIQYGTEGKVGDNFHGFAPWSAGCTTVAGNMSHYPHVGAESTGDWKLCETWFAAKPAGTLYSALWLEFDDLTARKALRIGSVSGTVKKMQKALGITADGAFGPKTFLAVRAKGIKNGIITAGIAKKYGVVL